MGIIRKFAGLTAALLLAVIGFTLLAIGTPLIGGLLFGIGVGAAIWQARILYITRDDPYDLSRLFDRPAIDEGHVDELADEDDVPFCFHCGHAVAKPFARCPECGNQVR